MVHIVIPEFPLNQIEPGYCPDIQTVHAMLKLDADLYDNVMSDMGL